MSEWVCLCGCGDNCECACGREGVCNAVRAWLTGKVINISFFISVLTLSRYVHFSFQLLKLVAKYTGQSCHSGSCRTNYFIYEKLIIWTGTGN